MSYYRHIGYYDHKADISELWPTDDMSDVAAADKVVINMKDGYGAFHTIDMGSIEMEEELFPDDFSDDIMGVTDDSKYIVFFNEGDWLSLVKADDDEDEEHGFFIDVWELIEDIKDEDDKEDEEESIESLWELAESQVEQLKNTIEKIKSKTK